MTPLMRPLRDRTILALILLVVGADFAADYLVPGSPIPAIFYVVPVLAAGYLLRPRTVAGVTVLVGVSYLLAAWPQQSALTLALRAAGFVVVGLLAWAFAVRAERETSLRVRMEGLAEERNRVERTLQTLIDTMPVGVLVSDATGKPVMANRAAVELVGAGQGDGEDPPQEECTLHRTDGSPYPVAELPLSRSVTTGETVRDEEILARREGGSEKVVLASAAPVCNVLGYVTGGVAVFQDITLYRLAEATLRLELEERRLVEAERERLLEEVRRRAAELGATISAIPEMVMICGPKGEIIHLNAAAEEMLGYSPAERALSLPERAAVIGLTTDEGGQCPPAELPAQRALRGETIKGMTFRFRSRSGKMIWVTASSAPVRLRDGKLVGAVTVFTNVTGIHESREGDTRRQGRPEVEPPPTA